ncbi:MAG: phosphoadenosine phosphosulfate reductase family protein [Oscillospiraceae bacterium]|nr:phosphoadenosine phosphosulfate reductase family protein [Oscillospiraceae bacterium]
MNTVKPKLHVVSLSGGKDSTAMLLMMAERKMPIDIILFCDTTVEFPAMHDHLDKLEKHVGIPITRIKADKSFAYYLLEHKVAVRNGNPGRAGYGWAGPRMRWCTSRLKTDVINAYLRPLKKEYDIVQYVGIAADELGRVKDKNYPLVDWGVTEKQALEYCYVRGFDFGGLYELFDRVSCWCCPLQGLAELRALRTNFPELWVQLLEWDRRSWRKFRADYSVEELERRFAFEEERGAAGLSISNRDFFRELKAMLGK